MVAAASKQLAEASYKILTGSLVPTPRGPSLAPMNNLSHVRTIPDFDVGKAERDRRMIEQNPLSKFGSQMGVRNPHQHSFPSASSPVPVHSGSFSSSQGSRAALPPAATTTSSGRQSSRPAYLSDSFGPSFSSSSSSHLSSHKLGLPNIGNTCYMNSVLQALRSLPFFMSTLNDDKLNNAVSCLPGTSLSISLRRLLQDDVYSDEKRQLLSDVKKAVAARNCLFEGATYMSRWDA
jgi:hypothetical protein